MSYGTHPYELGYVAGIIDGEGCIRLPRFYQPDVKVKMTDLDVLERCRATTGVGRISGPYTPEGCKPQWTWYVCGRDAAALLMTIYPLLGERRRARARDVLRRWRSVPYRTARYDGPADDKRCGTYAGYGRHYRAGTRPCRECAEAHNAYQRARRSK